MKLTKKELPSFSSEQLELIRNSAKRTIAFEIDGLKALQTESIDAAFESAVSLISSIEGRLIVSGMGKSGHVARKIAATFASTGTPALFVHPGEASHGDLGMITEKDAVMLLSNSGETKELHDIIQYTRRFSIPLIGVARRRGSALVESADVAIVLPEKPEASDFNAPTTSTTMMLALGDALAVSLLELRGFSAEDFHRYHPGGKLGAALRRVIELMHTDSSLPLVSPATKMQDVLIEMSSKRFGCVGIISQDKKLLGIITDGDLRRNITENFLQLSAEDIMTKNPRTIGKKILLVEALRLMEERSITQLFVLDEENHIEGIIHIHDILRAGLA